MEKLLIVMTGALFKRSTGMHERYFDVDGPLSSYAMRGEARCGDVAEEERVVEPRNAPVGTMGMKAVMDGEEWQVTVTRTETGRMTRTEAVSAEEVKQPTKASLQFQVE